MRKTKLFCLPHAGGSATSYFSWKRHLSNKVELRPIELAGRGKRFKEPLYESIEDTVKDIYEQISKELDSSPYALFGHSMGTILAYELARTMKIHNIHEPVHVFFSGRYPPYTKGEVKNMHLQSNDQFIAGISEFGGLSEEILNSREIMDMILPIIRADYRMVELYNHNNEDFKLNCDITVLNGTQDKYINFENVKRWKECTNKVCTFYEFDEGHFFINKFKTDVIKIINDVFQ